jgi:hypothetical protein
LSIVNNMKGDEQQCNIKSPVTFSKK